jgi:hypothetical protein
VRDELVRLDPRFAPEHATFYLSGLIGGLRPNDIPFSLAGFPPSYDDNKPLAFVLRRGAADRNIYIDADDMPELEPTALEWAHAYGKVNLDPSLVPPEYRSRVLPIGPSHGLRLWSIRDSFTVAHRTSREGGRLAAPKEHYRRYWLQARRRLGDAAYEPDRSEGRYVFYNGWLWAKHPEANDPRARFMRACKDLRPQVEFEGGFTPRRRDDVPGYADVISSRRYTLPEYLERVKRSAVVFNNPAVHHCLGWKLAEFLRLGKAIVTLPLSREMPFPVVHGVHVHVVDGTADSIQAAVRTITSDPAYRQHLEEGARSYYLDALTPARVLERLAGHAFDRTVADPPSD